MSCHEQPTQSRRRSRALRRRRVYAVGLWGTGEAVLDPAVICVGLEPDRVAALAGATPDSPLRRIWNVSEYAIEARVEPDLRDDEALLDAEQEALAALDAADVWDPDDFVVFAFHDGFGRELLENLRFSGGTAVALLDGRGLLPPAGPDHRADRT